MLQNTAGKYCVGDEVSVYNGHFTFALLAGSPWGIRYGGPLVSSRYSIMASWVGEGMNVSDSNK